jgi:NAD-dependent deacetylase
MRCKIDIESSWQSGAPTCFKCGKNKTRPHVVLFGEKLDQRLFSGLERFAKEADAVVAVGTSLNVFPAAGLVMDNSKKSIIINMDKTPFDKFARKVYHADCDSVIDAVLRSL